MSPLSNAIGEAFVTALLFGLVFASAAAGAVVLLGELSPGARPEQEFLNGLVVAIFAIYAAMIAGIAGIVTGALYGFTPRRARDIWMAIAIGVGVTLIGFIFTSVGALPPDFLVGLIALTVALSAVSGWIARKLFA